MFDDVSLDGEKRPRRQGLYRVPTYLICHSNQEIESRWQEEGTWNLKQLLHHIARQLIPYHSQLLVQHRSLQVR
jgi:hypothetical protein